MYIGTQFGCRHDTDIQVLAQLGVLHVDQTPAEPWTEWTADTLKALYATASPSTASRWR